MSGATYEESIPHKLFCIISTDTSWNVLGVHRRPDLGINQAPSLTSSPHDPPTQFAPGKSFPMLISILRKAY